MSYELYRLLVDSQREDLVAIFKKVAKIKSGVRSGRFKGFRQLNLDQRVETQCHVKKSP
jgi:hypothetical protein